MTLARCDDAQRAGHPIRRAGDGLKAKRSTAQVVGGVPYRAHDVRFHRARWLIQVVAAAVEERLKAMPEHINTLPQTRQQ